jgi:hypothetical protein
MNEVERDDLIQILTGNPWEARQRALNYVKTAPTSVAEPKSDKQPTKRTTAQNNSQWLDCEIIAKKLQDAGIDWKLIIREGGVDIPVTKNSVMEFLWRPVQKIVTGKESTRDLSKTEGEHGEIHEIIMRTLGQKHGIEWHDFPSNENYQGAVAYDEL